MSAVSRMNQGGHVTSAVPEALLGARIGAPEAALLALLSPGCLITPWAFEAGSTAECTPSGPEVCDGVDNDCDRLIDDEDDDLEVESGFEDRDGDGFGGAALRSCAAVAQGGDCDDDDPTRAPGAAAVCEDGVANDCGAPVPECGPEGGALLDVAAWGRRAAGPERFTNPIVVLDVGGVPMLAAGRTSGSGLPFVDLIDADGVGARSEDLADWSVTDLALSSSAVGPPALGLCTTSGFEVVELLSTSGGFASVSRATIDWDEAEATCSPLLFERDETLWFGGVLGGEGGGLMLWPVDAGAGARTDADPAALFIEGAPLASPLAGPGGDLDGDGLVDMVLGDIGDDPKILIYDGAASGLVPSYAFEGYVESSVSGDRFGGNIAPGGDVNGDGYDDLWVGGLESGSGQLRGRLWLFHGPIAGASTAADRAVATISGTADVELLGQTLSGGGHDVNGDGRGDLVVATYGSARLGVFLGPVEGSLGLDDAAVQWQGSGYGHVATIIPDLNEDGVDDVIVIGDEGREMHFIPGLGY